MSRYADAIKLSTKQWEAIAKEINAEGNGTANKLVELVADRLSRKRCKELLPKLVEQEVIKLTTPEALFAWTYGTAQVDGKRVEGVPGRKQAKIAITEAQWAKVTPKKTAAILREAQTEKRAAICMLAVMRARIYKPKAEDVVHLTNERVMIEGVKAPERTRRTLDLATLIAGIE